MRGIVTFLVVVAALGGIGYGLYYIWMRSKAETADKIDGTSLKFSQDVYPILKNNCFKCHGERDTKKGISYANYQTTMKTVVPNEPKKSKLYQSLLGEDAKQMPLNGKLQPKEIETIRAWIEAGAKGDS